MGSPRGWGEHSPHPSGEPSPSRWPNKRKNEVKRTCNFCPLLNSSCP
nr:MAG TPA: hypothetical protein [Caudoviricetes sp.]